MRKIIRLFGFILIVSGYIWILLWVARAIVPLPRSVFVETNEKYPPTKAYSHDEVLDAVGSAMKKFQDDALVVIVPTSLMLLGGILIDRGRKEAS